MAATPPIKSAPTMPAANLPDVPADLKPAILSAASTYGVDPTTLAAISHAETGFRNIAQQGGGLGRGYFQIDLGQHPGVTEEQAMDPQFSANFAAQMLKSNLDHFGGDTEKAMRAYNAGTHGNLYNSTTNADYNRMLQYINQANGQPLPTAGATTLTGNTGSAAINAAAAMPVSTKNGIFQPTVNPTTAGDAALPVMSGGDNRNGLPVISANNLGEYQNISQNIADSNTLPVAPQVASAQQLMVGKTGPTPVLNVNPQQQQAQNPMQMLMAMLQGRSANY